jgi:hypothetical protein
VLTVPESIVRLRLQPGKHELAVTWDGKSATHAVEGKAGDVRMVQLAGSLYAWESGYVWEAGDSEDARRRALKSRLVADLVIR